MGYYEGDSSRRLVVPDNEHGRAILLETVGHFCGGTDVWNGIVATYAQEFLRLQCFTSDWIHPNTIYQWIIQGLNRGVCYIINMLGTHMDIEATIDMANECERLVANPLPLDHIRDVNMEDMNEEEEDEDNEESSTSWNH
ncbi:hypothetical protein SAY86_001559 [Trapa natans]|uniref:Uncharacterized protein n=1 Tax=Trapa natans TaxID=22666 RepID=A0AAN7RMI6_TRANT|nr:hypothetical protein SAY86_001559 [Trapa natans]